MAKVVFVTPNFNGYVREEPVGTLLLATILRNAGIESQILPFHKFGMVENFSTFLQNAVNTIAEQKPVIISFYSRCDTYHISLKIAQQIKRLLPQTYIVFGGPQADLSVKETMEAIDYIDYICCGEGETTIVPFFSSLLGNKPDHSIRGLAYREDGQVVINEKPDLIADLDSLPMIDYSLFDFRETNQHYAVQKLFPIDVGRGCPFSCTFCSTKIFWGRRYRLKSAKRIIEEIKEINSRFGYTSFNFEHDMFTMNRTKVLQICEMIRNIGFEITWRCSARVDCLDYELIDVMADAGLTHIFVGIETGSPRMQREVQKNLKLDKVKDILTYINNRGIRFTASFIFGFPTETEEDFAQTIAMMCELSKLPKSDIQHHLCTFFPGTELTERYREQINQLSVPSDITGSIAIKECEDIILAHPELFPHFFEFKSDFREKVKYFPEFFRCWLVLRPVYEYIAQKYYTDKLYKMVYDFSNVNDNLLNEGSTFEKLISQEQFLDLFADDEHYRIVKEVARFLIWKTITKHDSKEIFKFDVSAFLNGTSITELNSAFSVVSLMRTDNGDVRLTLYKPM